MPENIPPAEHISHVVKRIKNTPPFLELDGSDAKGLVGTDGERGLVEDSNAIGSFSVGSFS